MSLGSIASAIHVHSRWGLSIKFTDCACCHEVSVMVPAASVYLSLVSVDAPTAGVDMSLLSTLVPIVGITISVAMKLTRT